MEKNRWCVGELAAHYEVTAKTIYEWLRTKRLPSKLTHRLPSGRLYFNPTEVAVFDCETDRKLQKVMNSNRT